MGGNSSKVVSEVLSPSEPHTYQLALLSKGKKAGILLWGFGGEVRGQGQGGDGRCSRSNDADADCC